ncbi:hypothetical protein HOY82DRAFT_491905, partial [Tuber indicum]
CNPQTAPLVQLATALYFLRLHRSSTVRRATQLGIGEGTVHLYGYRSLIALIRLLPYFICWPTPGSNEFHQMSSELELQSQFPN